MRPPLFGGLSDLCGSLFVAGLDTSVLEVESEKRGEKIGERRERRRYE